MNRLYDTKLKAVFFTRIIPIEEADTNVKDLLKDRATKLEPIWKDRITHIILISLLNEHTFERRPTCIKLIWSKMELFMFNLGGQLLFLPPEREKENIMLYLSH